MGAKGFRFRSPLVEISLPVRWVLLRAFGPAGATLPCAPDPASLFPAARSLDLASRIGSRTPRETLRAEIGDAAEDFCRESQRCADEAVVGSLVAQDAAIAARELSMPLVLLKFQALTAAGYVARNARGFSDVDVLVSDSDARRFRRGLLARGFRPSGEPAYEHQTSSVIHRFGVEVDVHRKILGVRISGSRSADARVLLERGLCVPLQGSPGEPAVPVRTVLVAHALAHGISQNGLAPGAYPLLRMVADLIDMDFPGDEGSSAEWLAWTSRDVSEVEISAIAALCRRLQSGGSIDECGTEERAFLAHVLVGATDPAYSRSLRLARFLREPTDHSRSGRVLRSVVAGIVRRTTR